MTTVFNIARTGRLGARPSAAFAIVAAAVAVAWACVAGTSPQDDQYEPTRVAIAASEVDRVLGPTTAEFEGAATELRDATAAWSAAVLAGGDATADRDAAREAWRVAMDAWERAEVLQVGPAGSSAYVIGGEDLRDEIYSWPTVDPCRVDEELAEKSYEGATFFTDMLVNVRGLAAVEYLLFDDDDANACAPTSPINEAGTWDAMGTDEITRRRAAYAAGAAAHVAELASELARTWEPNRGDFANWMSRPGEGDSPYEDGTDAIDDLFGATSYVDTILKDRKLAATTVADVESPWSRRSKEHALANLEGLRQLLLGGRTAEEGTGFDDLLVELGEPELADELMAALNEAIAAVGAIEGSYEDALTAEPTALATAQAAVQSLVELIKGPVTSALMLSRPGEAAGDAD